MMLARNNILVSFFLFLLPTLVDAQNCNVTSPSQDCNANNVHDRCELGSNILIIGDNGSVRSVKSNDCNNNLRPDDCDADLDEDSTIDQCETFNTCSGQCLSSFEFFDEDNDSVPNCQEIDDGTNACDTGSFVERLRPSACGSPNGFFQQVNVGTIINQRTQPLSVLAEYRNQRGELRGSLRFRLSSLEKKDIIINDLGLQPDTYGTLCVFTDATTNGAWNGGITLYKLRFPDHPFSVNETFDFALYYPFTNPRRDISSVSINTNTLGTNPQGAGTVANWLRVIDAQPGDNKGIKGSLFYYNGAGKVVAIDTVSIPDGGRFDYGAHEKIGRAAVGLAEFVPTSTTQEYYLETTRYFYEGVGATRNTFYTAFPVPVRSLTGEILKGTALSRPNELSVIEVVNGNNQSINSRLRVFDVTGAQLISQNLQVPRKGSIHKIVKDNVSAQATPGLAQIDGPPESVSALSLIYGFGSQGELLYGYAPSFGESAGTVQFTEFNSFIGHRNELEIMNPLTQTVEVNVTLLNRDQSVINSFKTSLAPKTTKRFSLTLPVDTYGTILVDSGAVSGLIVRNEVIKPGQYILPFPGR